MADFCTKVNLSSVKYLLSIDFVALSAKLHEPIRITETNRKAQIARNVKLLLAIIFYFTFIIITSIFDLMINLF